MSALTSELFLTSLQLLLHTTDKDTVGLIDELLELHYESMTKNSSQNDPMTKKFVTILEEMKKLPNNDKGKKEKITLLVRFLSDKDITADDILHRAMTEIFNDLDAQLDEDIVTKFQKQLTSSILWNRFNKQVKSMWNKMIAFNTTVDEDTKDLYLNDVVNAAREILNSTQNSCRLKNGAVERIDFSNKTSIEKSLEIYKQREVKNIMQTGLQGLNRMLGKRGGFALGESVCIYALLHNFKSGLLMTIARGLVCYNNPPFDCKGIPTVIFVSLENEANRNLVWLYRSAYENMTMTSADGKSDEEIVQFVLEYYNQKGYKLVIERWAGNKFGYEEMVELIESYEAEGHVIMGLIVDYANKMKKNKASKAAGIREDLQITELFENICTYTKTKGITFITAHQLNREAMKTLLTGKNNAVKNFSAAFAGGSIGVSQEIDLEIFVHLEKNHIGEKYLTMQRGKHRYVDSTPEAHQYCAYKFSPFGIADDIFKEPQFITDIYAVSASEANDKIEELGSLF